MRETTEWRAGVRALLSDVERFTYLLKKPGQQGRCARMPPA